MLFPVFRRQQIAPVYKYCGAKRTDLNRKYVFNLCYHLSYRDRRDSSSGRASASCAVGQDGCRIDTWPRPVATLLGAQHYQASTGFSSFTNHSSLTSHNGGSEDRMEEWHSC